MDCSDASKAQTLTWLGDGDFGPEEQQVMGALSHVHNKTLDEALLGLRRELEAQKTRKKSLW